MNILTTRYPFLCRHLTVFRKRAEPRLFRYEDKSCSLSNDTHLPS